MAEQSGRAKWFRAVREACSCPACQGSPYPGDGPCARAWSILQLALSVADRCAEICLEQYSPHDAMGDHPTPEMCAQAIKVEFQREWLERTPDHPNTGQTPPTEGETNRPTQKRSPQGGE